MYMWEEAEFFSVLGVDIYAYGLFAALGAAAMIGLMCLLVRARKMQKGAAQLTAVLSLVLGAFFSRLLFCLFSFNLGIPFSLKMLGLFTGGGYSMMGALLGGFLGAALSAKIMHQKPLAYMDVFSVAALGFVFFARLGEMFVPDFGISRSLIYEFTTKLPIAIGGEYDSSLATYLLEAACALAILLVLLPDLKKQKKPGQTFVLFLLLFGASQIIMESLRYDRHMSFTFIRMQQVMAILVLTGGVLYAAVRAGMKKQCWLLLGGMVLISGIGVGLEFAIDRTEINRYLLYLAFVALVAAPVYAGMKLRKKGN